MTNLRFNIWDRVSLLRFNAGMKPCKYVDRPVWDYFNAVRNQIAGLSFSITIESHLFRLTF